MHLKATITEDAENSVLDPLRIAFLASFAIAMLLQIYTVVIQGEPFDIQGFGIGVGSLIGITGAALFASSYQKEASDDRLAMGSRRSRRHHRFDSWDVDDSGFEPSGNSRYSNFGSGDESE